MHFALLVFAPVAELADAPDLGSGVNTCGFDPCQAHHTAAIFISRRIFVLRKNSMDKATKATLAALLGYSIFGFCFLFSKTALGFASPFLLLAVRFFIAFIALNAVLIFGKKKFSLKGKPVANLLLLGLIQPVCYFIFETYGINSTSAAFSGVMIGMVPVVGLIFGILFLREKCSLLQGLCTVFSVFGVYLTTSGGFGNVSAKGFLLLFCAVVSAALFTILSRKISKDFSAFERTYVMFLLGSAVFIPVAFFEGQNDFSAMLKPFSEPLFWISVIYLAIISSVCAFLLINSALNHIPAGRALIFSNFTTVISVLAGIFIMGDSFSGIQLFGILIITISVFGVSYNGKNKKHTA